MYNTKERTKEDKQRNWNIPLDKVELDSNRLNWSQTPGERFSQPTQVVCHYEDNPANGKWPKVLPEIFSTTVRNHLKKIIKRIIRHFRKYT